MKIKKKILAVIAIYITINLIVVGVRFLIKQFNTGSDDTKILTEQEMKKVMDNTIIELGVNSTKHTFKDDGGLNRTYGADFKDGNFDISLTIWDMSRWDQERLDKYGGVPNTTYENYVRNEYNSLKEELAERTQNMLDVGDRVPRYTIDLEQIQGFDTLIRSYPKGEVGDRDEQIANTAIGFYDVRVWVQSDVTGLNLDARARLEILVKNILETLSK